MSDVVYTNVMSAGAYRGYGATQGLFAVESAVNELAAKLHMDPFEIREKNIVKEGDVMPAYYGQVNTSCALDRCLGAREGDDRLGGKVSGPRYGQRKGPCCRNGNGDAGLRYYIRRCGKCDDQGQ